jgi:4a-hydroxytetrahydrobiopterin dehydratase
MTTYTGKEIAEQGLDGWVYLPGGLQTRIATPDFAAGVKLVAAIGAVTAAEPHHPDVDLRSTHVDVRLTCYDTKGVTDRDIRLARTVSAVAADAGLTADRTGVSRLELALDSPQYTAVLPFWAAVLAGEPDDNEVRDPADVLPAIWFQKSGREEPRQRWHPDVWVDPADVQPRIDAALAADGTLVSDAEAPSFWVLADPEGNKVCLCTWQDRGDLVDF